VAAILVAAACTADSRSPTAPEVGPRSVISDAGHTGPVPGFFFLPPMAKQVSYSGTFDPALQPSVEVCKLSGTSCGSTVATFTFGAGPQNVRVDAQAQQYYVNWKIDKSLDTNATYRVTVRSGTFVLGYADVVLAKGNEKKNVDTSQFVVAKSGETLPIKFRIETGIVGQINVTPALDSVAVADSAQFTATLIDLHGNTITGPTVTWSSSDNSVATVDANGRAHGVAVGTATITASLGYVSGSATAVVFNPDTPPVANPDTFSAIGNVTISVAAPGVLGNDTDAETPGGIQAVPGTITTANGGTVVLAADGSFTYLSAAGYTGDDSFSYQATDGQLQSGPATVTVHVPTRVWYVSNAGAAPGDGRDSSPFAALASAEGPSAAGETIFLLYGNGTSAGYDAGFTFKAGQSLTGQGVPSSVTATVNGQPATLLAAGNAPMVTDASAGATLRLATNNTVQGVNVASTAGAGISGSGFGTLTASTVNVAAQGGPSLDLQNGTAAASFATLSSSGSTASGLRLVSVGGTLSAPAGVVTNAAGDGVLVSGGNGTVTYGGSISGSGTHGALVNGRTGGALTLSGDVSDAGGGIVVQNNTGGTIAFTGASKALSTGANDGVTLSSNAGATVSFGGGGLAIATTTGTGFSATGGGTVNVTGANNAIGATSGTALSVTNTTIGASGLTFRSISASNATNGIVLVNTGAVSGLQVTGTGSAGSGGTIDHMSGADGATAGNGVYLSNTRDVTLTSMSLHDFDNYAIRGVGVADFTLDGSTVSGVNGTSAAGLEGSIAFDGLTGAATVSNSSVSGGLTDNVRVVNTSGVLDRLTVSGTTIGANSAASGRDGLNLSAQGSAVLNVTVSNSSFTGARSLLLDVVLSSGGTSDVVLNGNAFSNNHPAIAAGAGGVALSGTGAGLTLTYAITNNTFRDAVGSALSVTKGAGTGNFSGTISGNAIGVAAVANSGSLQGSGISMIAVGGGVQTFALTNNQVRQYNGNGVLLQIGDATSGGNGTLNATVTGNTLANPGTAPTVKTGVSVNVGTTTGDAPQMCLALGGAGVAANSMTGSGPAPGFDFRLRQRFLSTVRLPGYASANNNNAAVTAFVQGNNGGTPTGQVTNTVSTGGGGFVGGAACPLP
jgi:hypothetical protein